MSRSGSVDTRRRREHDDRLVTWLFTRLNRLLLTAGIAVGMLCLLVVLSLVSPTPMRHVVAEFEAIWWVFSALITGIITAVTLVVTFNQLVLSQELGALGDQRNRMQEASAFRADLEPYLERNVSPLTPASFLRVLLAAIGRRAKVLDADKLGGETRINSDLERFTTELIDDVQSVEALLEEAQFGTFDVIFGALQFNYSRKMYEAEQLLGDHREALDAEAVEALETIVTLLEFFGPAREHFKTLYFQWELVTLSRRMLYTSIPALLVTFGMLLFVDPADVTGAILGVDTLVWLVCTALTVTLVPFFLLIAYVVRIATVTKRTLAMGPFVLREVESTRPPGETGSESTGPLGETDSEAAN